MFRIRPFFLISRSATRTSAALLVLGNHKWQDNLGDGERALDIDVDDVLYLVMFGFRKVDGHIMRTANVIDLLYVRA